MNVPAPPWAAVVLAGGQGRRLGGRDKPAMTVGGRTLLAIALDAAHAGGRVVVVGPARPALNDGAASIGSAALTWTREQPPGGGPAAALAAGVRALVEGQPLPPAGALVAVLAADLPAITAGTVDRLAAALGGDPDAEASAPMNESPDGALLVDGAGHRQLLAGVWRFDRLRAAVGGRTDWRGAALRDLLAPLRAVEVAALEPESADLDTPDDVLRWRAR